MEFTFRIISMPLYLIILKASSLFRNNPVTCVGRGETPSTFTITASDHADCVPLWLPPSSSRCIAFRLPSRMRTDMDNHYHPPCQTFNLDDTSIRCDRNVRTQRATEGWNSAR